MIMSLFGIPFLSKMLIASTDKDVLNNVKIYTSSERRVIVSDSSGAGPAC